MQRFYLDECVIPTRRHLKRSFAAHHYRPVVSTSLTWSYLERLIISSHNLGNSEQAFHQHRGFERKLFLGKMMANFFRLEIAAAILACLVCVAHTWPIAGNCQPCDCYLDSSNSSPQFRGRTADCSNRNLTDIPTSLDPNIDHLILNGNGLLSIREKDLSVYQQLKTLRIRDNKLITIEPDVFEHCPLLYHVDLTGNSFKILPDDVFRKAPLLRELHGVQMENLPNNLFHNLSKLHTLSVVVTQDNIPIEQFQHLSINELSLELVKSKQIDKDLLRPIATTLMRFTLDAPELLSIDQNLFNDMILLEKIHLDVPKVDFLPEDIFLGERLVAVDMTEMLQNIVSDVFDSYLAPEKSMMLKDVSFKGIREFPPKLFRHSPYIERLTIHNAEVIPSDLFKNLRRLNTLDLSQNSLEDLPGLWFSDLDGLKDLDLSYNELQRIQLQIFQLQSLKKLDLSHNQIRHINKMAFSSFSASLEILDLSHNELTALQPQLLGTMWSLSSLDLSNNYIQRLPSRVFADLQKLQSLLLQHNHIQLVSTDSFAGLQDLTSLDIHDNYIKELPDSSMLDDSTYLSTVDMSNNNLIIIPNDIFSNHFWLKKVDLNHNQIMCGCSIEHLQELIDEYYTEVTGDCFLDTNMVEDVSATSQTAIKEVSIVEVNSTAACFYERNRTLTRMHVTERKPPVILFSEEKSPVQSVLLPESNVIPESSAVRGAHQQITGNDFADHEHPSYLNPMLWTIGSAILLCAVAIGAVIAHKMKGVMYRRSYQVGLGDTTISSRVGFADTTLTSLPEARIPQSLSNTSVRS